MSKREPEDFRSSLTDIVGSENLVGAEKHEEYSKDMGDFEGIPTAVVKPRSEQDIIKLVEVANRDHLPIVTWGAGSSLTGAAVLAGSLVLDMSSLNKILKIDPVNWFVQVEPGVVLEDLNNELERHGFYFPPDPASSFMCTVGGAIAEGSGGMRCVKYGTMKDWVMALRVVLANGQVVNLGEPLPKNRAGYDLTHLMVGSEGTLGIIVQAWLKIIPLPKVEVKMMQVSFAELDSTQQAIQEIRKARITPRMLEFLGRETVEAINGATDLDLPEAEAILLIEVEEDGTGAFEQALEICRSSGASDIRIPKDEEEAERIYSARGMAYLALKPLASGMHVEDVVVPIDRLAEYLQLVKSTGKRYGLKIPMVGHAGDGNVHPNILFDKDDPESVKAADKAFEEICRYAIRVGGSVTGEHGVGVQKMIFLREQLLAHDGKEALRLMKSIKKLFDPNGILNPGKYVEVDG